MKNYVKPNLEYVLLAVEERFAVGSGSGCTCWGTCLPGVTSFTDEEGVLHIVNHEAPKS